MAEALCLGEALIDFVADVTGVTLAECPGFRKAPGGAPANVAVGLARLGVSAAFLGKVGDDAFGHFLADTFADAGVDTRFMRFDAAARTGLAFVSLRADGERDFAFFRNPSADMLYRPDEIPEAAFDGCRIYHYGSITLIQDPSRAATLDALRRAKARGAVISYDPNLRPPLWPDLDVARERILEGMPHADFVKVSEEEAEFLFGPSDLSAHAAALMDRGPRLVAITLGANGAYLANRTAAVRLPGFAVQAVDTTGAGDGFVAGVLSELPSEDPGDISADDLECIGRLACAVGALACTRKGAIPSLPLRSEALAFLSEYG